MAEAEKPCNLRQYPARPRASGDPGSNREIVGISLDSRFRGNERRFSARRQHHDHLAAFEARLGFDLGERAGVFLDAVEQFIAELLVRHFAAAEAQGDLDLVAFLEET